MQTSRSEEGQTLVLTALAMTVMLGFLALALDVGILFKTRRWMQTAADAAATAGALNYYFYGNADLATGAAKAASEDNHFKDGADQVIVTVNAPPKSGPNQSKGFVEVIITKPVPTVFMGIFGRNSVGVTTRAVAGSPGYSDNCVWIMNKHASAAFDMRGSSQIHAKGCSIYVNSDSTSGIKNQGNPYFDGTSIDVVGSYSGHDSSPTHITTAAMAETPAIPLTLDAPKPCGYTFTGGEVKTSDVAAIRTGAATNGIVCFTANVTFDAGDILPGSASGISYVFSNGATIASGKNTVVQFGSATLNDDGTFSDTKGATLIFTGGKLTQSPGKGQQTGLSIYAPANPDSPYNGLAVMYPASNKDTSKITIQWGDTGAIFDGMIYAPTRFVEIQDNGNAIAAAGVIADTMLVQATKQFTLLSYSSYNPITTPLKQITLVE